MFQKVLVANRGEIAIRAFRAATELGIRTVAVYAYEDRYSPHRLKADESYQIGTPGHPLRSYLDVDSIVGKALQCGADAIYPGYGFLSENPLLARACEENGIKFIGPSAQVLALTGNKVKALEAASQAQIPVLQSIKSNSDPKALAIAAEEIDFPVFVKAAAGGGGRGLRLVQSQKDIISSINSAMAEAELAFGDSTVFIEQAVIRPRHIEVQILADSSGNTVHLFERDCSVQRRHQKVVEIAPAPNLDPEIRENICADAVHFAKTIGYQNAGTVEFLLDDAGKHVFIEMNPRIQVEHTVTEEVTGIDIVQAQLRIASGESLSDLKIDQDCIQVLGSALQCRVTTEDPSADFRPDTGRISAYRTPGGAGVRLDEATYAGAEVLPYFDSMLVKVTCRGRNFSQAVDRSARALAEFRIRGVSTNVSFLLELLSDPDFRSGNITTAFIEEHPQLLKAKRSADRGTRLLGYLADVSVNKPNGEAPLKIDPISKLHELDLSQPIPDGSRQLLDKVGPAEFSRMLRNQTSIAITDTTLRDAHQSLLATRLRSFDLLTVAPYIARLTPQLLSLEAWGGATYDVALRFLKEDPWERLIELRERVPNICLQMLLRGQNTVAYTPQPQKVTEVFIKQAAAKGIDIFRIFDALNDVSQMRPAIDAVLSEGKVVEGTLCYTGNLSSPSENLYTLNYYLRLAEQLVEAGAHILCIKDMAGICSAPAARTLVSSLRSNFDLPVHMHTHDTSGGQLAAYLAALEAGVDAIDGANPALAGTTSQPSLSAIVAATDYTKHSSGISLEALSSLEPYWQSIRQLYEPFESGIPSPTGRVYRHEIPGGQISNLRQQAIALGVGDRFEEVEETYARVNEMLGNIIKVTPSSKVVGDLAVHLVAKGVDPDDFAQSPDKYDIPESVIGFLAGELGTPPGGWPEPFRTKALEGRKITGYGPKPLTSEQDDELNGSDPTEILNEILFPGPTHDYREAVESFGSLSVLPTSPFFYGLAPGEETAVLLSPGVKLYLSLDAIGLADVRGYRDVYCRLNGQPRVVSVRDRSVKAEKPANERADAANPRHIAVPFSGVVSVQISQGDRVTAGQTVATIEAMKMEAAITSPVDGVIERVAISKVSRVEAGDLIAVVEDGP